MIQAAIIRPASLLARFVTAAAAIGNIAVLARWNKTTQNSKTQSTRGLSETVTIARAIARPPQAKAAGRGRSGGELAPRKLQALPMPGSRGSRRTEKLRGR